jgi:hypothetical protein
MNLIALGFWISLGLAVLEVLHVISIGWLLVATPFLLGIGISVGIIVIAFVVGLLIVMITGK